MEEEKREKANELEIVEKNNKEYVKSSYMKQSHLSPVLCYLQSMLPFIIALSSSA